MDKHKSLLICSTVNNEFFHYLENLLHSVERHNTKCNFLFDLVNVAPYKINWLRQTYPNCVVNDIRVNFPNKEIEKSFCSSRRVCLLNNEIVKNFDWVFYLDANTLVEINLNQLVKNNNESDVIFLIDERHFLYHKEIKENKKYQLGPLGTPFYGVCTAGIQGYRVCGKVLGFLSHYKEIVHPLKYSWFSDQEGLYLSYLKYQNSLTFTNIMPHIAFDEFHKDKWFIYMKGGKSDIYSERSAFYRDMNVKSNYKLDLSILANVKNYDYIHIPIYKKIKRMACGQHARNVNEIINFKKGVVMLVEMLKRIDFLINSKILGRRYVKRKLKYFSMYLDFTTPGISKTLAVKGTREEDMIYLIKKYLKPGYDVIDCGSNIGIYPIFESLIIGPNTNMLCIEPDPRNFELLEKNVKLINPLVKVNTLNIAISDKVGVASLDVDCASNLNKITSKKSSSENNTGIQVQTDTVDNLVGRYGLNPMFLRMDIEGHEVEVISGMQETLTNAPSGFILFFEIHPKEYSEEHSLSNQLDFLFSIGFNCEVIVSAGIPIPTQFQKLGYTPDKIIKSDGMKRGLYYSVSNEDSSILTSSLPKCVRYILLKKV